jgi:hypothetical protein
MRGPNLQDAISELIAKAQTDRSVLHVAHEAVRLAKVYGGDSCEIAVLITNTGLIARINMEMDMPQPSARGALYCPPDVHRPIGPALDQPAQRPAPAHRFAVAREGVRRDGPFIPADCRRQPLE